MNCCLKSGIHEQSPNSRAHIEVFHFALRSSIVSLSHNRIDFVHVRYDCRGYVNMCRHFLLTALGFPGFSEMLEAPRFLRASFVSNRLSCFFILVDSENSHVPGSPLLRQVSPRFHPSTRQGIHLSASLENSALRQASNFFLSCLPVSLQL